MPRGQWFESCIFHRPMSLCPVFVLQVAVEAAHGWMKIQPPVQTIGEACVSALNRANRQGGFDKSKPVLPFTNMDWLLIPAWISNHMPGNMGDEITYPLINFNSCTVEV